MKESYITAICVFVCILVVLSGGVGYVFYKYTLVEWWLPVVIALVPAILTLCFYKSWSRIVGISNKYIAMICHIICVGIFSYMLFIIFNYSFRDAESRQEVNVLVSKYSQEKERHYNKRNHSNRKRKVKRYYLEITFEDGLTKTLIVSKNKYDKINDGSMKIYLEKGLFGFPVIDL